MEKPVIDKNIHIEDLVTNYPYSVKYLMEKGIRCIMCGEPIWGTLDEAAKEKKFSDAEIQNFINELNLMSERI
jgi:methionine synthase II (cobalamin-independent)